MKVHWGGTVVALLVFNVFTRQMEFVRITPRPLYSRWKNPHFQKVGKINGMKAQGPREWRVSHYTDLGTRWRWRSASSCTCFRRGEKNRCNFLVCVMENVTNRHFNKISVSRPSNYILNVVLITGCHVIWRNVLHERTVFELSHVHWDTKKC
jgi:hypothetical protein